MINGRQVKACGYIRMSSDKQETSPAQQKREIEQYATKNGYAIVKWYRDEGISGDDTERLLQKGLEAPSELAVGELVEHDGSRDAEGVATEHREPEAGASEAVAQDHDDQDRRRDQQRLVRDQQCGPEPQTADEPVARSPPVHQPLDREGCLDCQKQA